MLMRFLPKKEMRKNKKGTWFQPGWTPAYKLPENLFPFHCNLDGNKMLKANLKDKLFN